MPSFCFRLSPCLRCRENLCEFRVSFVADLRPNAIFPPTDIQALANLGADSTSVLLIPIEIVERGVGEQQRHRQGTTRDGGARACERGNGDDGWCGVMALDLGQCVSSCFSRDLCAMVRSLRVSNAVLVDGEHGLILRQTR